MVPGFEREFDYRCKEVDIAPGCNPVMAPGSKPVPFWCDEHVSRELVTACLPAFPHKGIFRDISQVYQAEISTGRTEIRPNLLGRAERVVRQTKEIERSEE